MVLSTPSVSFTSLNDYMASLYKLRRLDFDKIYLSHTSETDSVLVDAKPTLQRYIEYRLASEQKMLNSIKP